MKNPVEQIENISNMDDFLNFLVQLAMNAKEHPEEWANKSINDYLGQTALDRAKGKGNVEATELLEKLMSI